MTVVTAAGFAAKTGHPLKFVQMVLDDWAKGRRRRTRRRRLRAHPDRMELGCTCAECEGVEDVA